LGGGHASCSAYATAPNGTPYSKRSKTAFAMRDKETIDSAFLEGKSAFVHVNYLTIASCDDLPEHRQRNDASTPIRPTDHRA
jgi:hypothetical protein